MMSKPVLEPEKLSHDAKGSTAWIIDYGGQQFDLLHPEDNEFPVETIAHALSHICRFTGHTDKFYSVAEHCVRGSRLVKPEYALDFLFHDASEAWYGDISRPLKNELPVYRDLEHRCQNAIARAYRLNFVHDAEIKRVDNLLLATEARELNGDPVWCQDWPKLSVENSVFFGLSPSVAKRAWLDRFNYLKKYHGWCPGCRARHCFEPGNFNGTPVYTCNIANITVHSI